MRTREIEGFAAKVNSGGCPGTSVRPLAGDRRAKPKGVRRQVATFDMADQLGMASDDLRATNTRPGVEPTETRTSSRSPDAFGAGSPWTLRHEAKPACEMDSAL